MREAYIYDGIRTPIGKFSGSLSYVRPDDLAAMTIKKLLEKHSIIDPNEIDDVILALNLKLLKRILIN